MANDYPALADLTIINDANNTDIDVNDLFDDAPLVARMAAVTASNGTLHKYYKRTGAPVVGFRAVNEGREHDSTDRVQVTETLQILDASFTVDTAIARSFRGGAEAYLRMEAMSHMRAAFFKLEQQIINGTIDGDAAGFTGLQDAYDDLAATGAVCIGAGGTTALTSVYLIRAGMDDIAVVAGNDGNIEIEPSTVQRIAGATTGWLNAYVTPIQAYYGFQQGSLASAVRIANLDAGSNTLDDDTIYNALSYFPSSRQPNMIVMNRRSLEQLRAARQATNATGAPAPRPTEVEGIPIIVTDALSNSETAVT